MTLPAQLAKSLIQALELLAQRCCRGLWVACCVYIAMDAAASWLPHGACVTSVATAWACSAVPSTTGTDTDCYSVLLLHHAQGHTLQLVCS